MVQPTVDEIVNVDWNQVNNDVLEHRAGSCLFSGMVSPLVPVTMDLITVPDRSELIACVATAGIAIAKMVHLRNLTALMRNYVAMDPEIEVAAERLGKAVVDEYVAELEKRRQNPPVVSVSAGFTVETFPQRSSIFPRAA